MGWPASTIACLGADNLPLRPPRRPEQPRIVFSPDTKTWEAKTQRWKWRGGTIGLPGLAVADVDADGDLDVCLAGMDDQGSAVLWRNEGGGKFAAGPDAGRPGRLALLRRRRQRRRRGPLARACRRGSGAAERRQRQLLAGGLRRAGRPGRADAHRPPGRPGQRRRFGLPGFSAEQGRCSPGRRVRPGRRAASSATTATARLPIWPAEFGLDFKDTAVAAVVYDDFDNDYDLDLIVFPAQGEARRLGQPPSGRTSPAGRGGNGLDGAETHAAPCRPIRTRTATATCSCSLGTAFGC